MSRREPGLQRHRMAGLCSILGNHGHEELPGDRGDCGGGMRRFARCTAAISADRPVRCSVPPEVCSSNSQRQSQLPRWTAGLSQQVRCLDDGRSSPLIGLDPTPPARSVTSEKTTHLISLQSSANHHSFHQLHHRAHHRHVSSIRQPGPHKAQRPPDHPPGHSMPLLSIHSAIPRLLPRHALVATCHRANHLIAIPASLGLDHHPSRVPLQDAAL